MHRLIVQKMSVLVWDVSFGCEQKNVLSLGKVQWTPLSEQPDLCTAMNHVWLCLLSFLMFQSSKLTSRRFPAPLHIRKNAVIASNVEVNETFMRSSSYARMICNHVDQRFPSIYSHHFSQAVHNLKSCEKRCHNSLSEARNFVALERQYRR